MEQFKPVISFKDQPEGFTHGVEFGRLLEKMQRKDNTIENHGFPIRIENQNLIRESCIHYGYIPTFGDEFLDGWVPFLGVKQVSSDN